MKTARAPAEQLPPPIDLEELAARNDITLADATWLIRIAEHRGQAFSRIDSETGKMKWYWREH
jgi:hypothetical protein